MARRLVMGPCLLAAATTGTLSGQTPELSAGGLRVTTIATSRPLLSQGRLGGVAVDRSGHVFVSNFGGTAWRVEPDGQVVTLARDLQGSSGNAVDPDGNLYQASFRDGRIVRIAPAGTITDLVPGGLAGPIGLAVAVDGSVFVCQCRSNSIARVSPDGQISRFAASPDLDCPNGITIGPDGALYVVSFQNGHVVRIEMSGSTERFATIPAGRNAHIAFARGAFWVTKIEANVLYRLTREGHAELYAGTGGLGFTDGPLSEAPLARPNGIAVTPGGDALIVNTLDGRWRADEGTRIVLRRVDLPR